MNFYLDLLYFIHFNLGNYFQKLPETLHVV